MHLITWQSSQGLCVIVHADSFHVSCHRVIEFCISGSLLSLCTSLVSALVDRSCSSLKLGAWALKRPWFQISYYLLCLLSFPIYTHSMVVRTASASHIYPLCFIRVDLLGPSLAFWPISAHSGDLLLRLYPKPCIKHTTRNGQTQLFMRSCKGTHNLFNIDLIHLENQTGRYSSF